MELEELVELEELLGSVDWAELDMLALKTLVPQVTVAPILVPTGTDLQDRILELKGKLPQPIRKQQEAIH